VVDKYQNMDINVKRCIGQKGYFSHLKLYN